jgi:hypothetical protein
LLRVIIKIFLRNFQISLDKSAEICYNYIKGFDTPFIITEGDYFNMSNQNETTVAVYNKQDARARNILAKTAFDDIGQQEVPCTLRVNVTSAFFKEQQVPNGLHRPYMEINGEVSEVFIEEDDDRYFPCGTKSMTMMTPQDVRIFYIPTTDELQDLVQMGIYYSDFDVPADLVGNTIEIPSNITYTCVYDTCIGMVDINNPFEISTSTIVNHYDGIFNGCAVSEMRAKESSAEKLIESMQTGLTLDTFAEDDKTAGYKSVLEDYYEDDISEQAEEDVPMSEEDEEQAAIRKFKTVLEEHDKQVAEKQEEIKQNESVRRATVAQIRKAAKARAKQQEQQKYAEQDVYAQLMGETNADKQPAKSSEKLKYDVFKDAMHILEKSYSESMSKINGVYEDAGLTKSDKDAKDSREAARRVDIARDNQALNKGITDISGFGADESGNESKMTDEQRKKMQAKKSRDAARIVDRALDNQALNRGETDIAGQGAGNSNASEKAKNEARAKAADAMRNLLGGGRSTPKPSGSDSPEYI